jgi:SAM-dependent methyltransferase
VRTEASGALAHFIAQAPMHRGAIVRAVAEAAAAVPAGAVVLDAGAGDAPYRPFFAHCDYRTQDWPSSVHEGASRADVVADLHELPAELSGRFDFVLCTEVLEHVADPARVLRELARVLRPGGQILLTVPFVSGLHEEPYDYWRFTSYALADLLARTGFSGESIAPLAGWYSNLAHQLRFGGVVTLPHGERAPMRARLLVRLMIYAAVLLEKLAPRLDRLDSRRALPVGWVARATRAEGG